MFMNANKSFYEPIDRYERELAVLEKLTQKENNALLDQPKICDLCASLFYNRRFIIDACLDSDKNPWGYVCAECFIKYNLKLGKGKGQMYAHLKNGSWLLTAGY